MHSEDDELICGLVRAALDYAFTFQKLGKLWQKIPLSTEQAVIMLATHFYESRDGSTGGFFANTTSAAKNVMETVHLLLSIHKEH